MPETPQPRDPEQLDALVESVRRRAPMDAVNLLDDEDDDTVVAVLNRLPPALTIKLLNHFPDHRTAAIASRVATGAGNQWEQNQNYPEESLGRLMEPVSAVFSGDTSVADCIDSIRELARDHLFTYAYVTDAEQRLIGLVVMRDLLLAERGQRLSEIMLDNPFYFTPEIKVSDAMQAMLQRHYPAYPVCDAGRRLIGLVQGHVLFEEHAFQLTAQSGRMVGVEKEEHLHTHWKTSFRFRHPWLQINLLTAFLAAFVVGLFEGTIDKVVLLAVFLPVLAGQAGNTGSQSLAITLRGMTLGELKKGAFRFVALKEALLGVANGALVGLVAGAAMYGYAVFNHSPVAFSLGLVVFMAMIGSCVVAGISGVLVPLALEKAGADPVTASSIFLTTATDVISMGMFLWFATLIVL